MGKKIKKKLTKEQKQLLIALLIGDGTISNNYVFKLSHGIEQSEYLLWKIKLLNDNNIKNNGIKEYISSCGYNLGKSVVYSQLSIIPTIKALRRTVYTPKKTITRKLLNWLNPLGVAIWFMDDGMINVNTSIQRSSTQHTFRIATCCSKSEVEIIIAYFMDVWGIKFNAFEERPEKYSIMTSGEDAAYKFAKLVSPYVRQVPSLLYKIRTDGTKTEFLENQNKGLKCETLA